MPVSGSPPARLTPQGQMLGLTPTHGFQCPVRGPRASVCGRGSEGVQGVEMGEPLPGSCPGWVGKWSEWSQVTCHLSVLGTSHSLALLWLVACLPCCPGNEDPIARLCQSPWRLCPGARHGVWKRVGGRCLRFAITACGGRVPSDRTERRMSRRRTGPDASCLRTQRGPRGSGPQETKRYLSDRDAFCLRGYRGRPEGQELGGRAQERVLTPPASLCPSSAGAADGPRAPTHLARPEGPAAEVHPGDQGRAAAVLRHQ